MTHELEFHADALPGHTNPDDEAERLPINYVELTLRYKWWLMGSLLIGGTLGYLAYVKAGPEYEAVGQILVSRKYTPPVRANERVLEDAEKPSEHIALILSPMIAEKAIEIGNLKNLSTFWGEPDLVEAVLDGLKVKRVSGQDRSHFNVFEVRYPSQNASDARKVAQSVIAAYEDYLEQQSREHSREVLALAQKTTADLAVKLREKEAEYRDFLSTVPEEFRSALGPKTLSTQTTNLAPEDVIQTLGAERNKNRIRMAELTSRQKSIQQAIARGDARESIEVEVRRFLSVDGRAGEQVNNQTEISIYQSQLLPLILREQNLSRDFGRDHPELVSVKQSIAKIVETFERLGVQLPEGIDVNAADRTSPFHLDYVAVFLESVRQQLKEGELRDMELESLIKLEGGRSREFSLYRSTDENLRSEVTQLQQLWQKRLDRESEVAIEKDTNGYTLKILAPVKDALVLKRIIKFVGGGAIFGAFLVGLVCLMRELNDRTLKTVRDVRTTLRQPVLGSVVAFDQPVDSSGGSSRLPHPALRYLLSPNSIEAENYRSIRTAILVSAEQSSIRTILVSSPEPGDGKTTFISNLALAMAQSGQRVLLIDGDLRRPNVHTLFRMTQGVGLTEVLSGEIDALNAVRPSVIDGLSLMTAGEVPSNPSELLSSPRLQKAIQELKDEFDFVLVDAPPLLAVSDPCILARVTDGLLVVTRINKNSRTVAVRVRELIESQGIRVLGAVANGAVIGPERNGGYYGEYLSPTNSAASKSEPTTEPVGV